MTMTNPICTTTSTTTPAPIPCTLCSGNVPYRYDVKFNGSISDGSCSGCNEFLTYPPVPGSITIFPIDNDISACIWEGGFSDVTNCNSSVQVELSISALTSPDRVRLYLKVEQNSVLQAEFEEIVSGTSIDCDTVRTLTRMASPPGILCDWSGITSATVTPH